MDACSRNLDKTPPHDIINQITVFRRVRAMKKILVRTLLTTVLLACSGMHVAAQAAQPIQQGSSDNTFGIGIGYLNGNTLYHISSYDTSGSGIESELEFPLKTILFGLEGGYISKDDKGRDAFRINLQWFTNIDNGSGKLKDSDWLTNDLDIQAPPSPPNPPNSGYPHPGKDIYSESDISLKANIIDIRGSYNNWISDTLSVGPLGGFLYQKFQFDASNVHQTGYGPYSPWYTGTVPGKVLTYEVTYAVPYFGIHSELQLTRTFQAAADVAYSPWAAAEDKDDHLLRKKVSRGSTTGKAYLVTLFAQWDMKDNDSFLVRGQYLKIDTTGTQTQTFYDGSGAVFTGIDDKITSQQTSVTFLFSHRF
jgi:outer membrane protease